MKVLKSLMLSLIVLLALQSPAILAQSIPRLSSAVSASDSIKTLKYQVVALDGRLSICEKAVADSTIAHQKQLKTVRRQRFWKGVKKGIGGTIIVEALFILGRAIAKH